MHKIEIDQEDFIRAFGRDWEFHDVCPRNTYLDQEDGNVLLVYEDDEDASFEDGIPAEENRVMRERIEATPDRYLEISGLSHGEHHEILREFLDSDWTSDEQEKDKARSAYFKSIGGWIKKLHDSDNSDIVCRFYTFRDLKIRQLAKEFLNENNIDPGWE